MPRFINPFQRHVDDAGKPLVGDAGTPANGATLTFFKTGTSTFLDIFSDVNEAIPLENPVPLSGAGQEPSIFYTGSARVILRDDDGVQIGERDPVTAGAGGGGAFSEWNSLTIFSINDLVVASDGCYYRSFTNGNAGNDPVTSPTAWEKVEFTSIWNPNITYELISVVKGSDGFLYKSAIAINLNNDPTTDQINWGSAVSTTLKPVIRSAALTFASENF